jgi:hypothetical protein
MAFDSRLLAGVGVLAAVVESGNFRQSREGARSDTVGG